MSLFVAVSSNPNDTVSLPVYNLYKSDTGFLDATNEFILVSINIIFYL